VYFFPDENEGIYVRDIRTGRVRSVIGKTYMLTQDEELWEKELPLKIEQFIQKESSIEKHVRIKDSDTKSTTTTRRDKTKLVVYRLPANDRN
jgi:major vault protein